MDFEQIAPQAIYGASFIANGPDAESVALGNPFFTENSIFSNGDLKMTRVCSVLAQIAQRISYFKRIFKACKVELRDLLHHLHIKLY